jgi:hypothetical protein
VAVLKMAPHLFLEISRPDLADLPLLAAHEGKITDLQHLASYSWLAEPVPTIAVPGKDPRARSVVEILALIELSKVLRLSGRRPRFRRS